MRRTKIIALSLLLALLCSACGKNYCETHEEMLQVIKAEKSISDELTECGFFESGDSVIILGKAGNDYQPPGFYGAEFSIVEPGKYRFERTLKLRQDWRRIEYFWKRGMILVCFDDKAVALRVTTEKDDGERVTAEVAIGETPWTYYLELFDDPDGEVVEYVFIDANGKVLP